MVYIFSWAIATGCRKNYHKRSQDNLLAVAGRVTRPRRRKVSPRRDGPDWFRADGDRAAEVSRGSDNEHANLVAKDLKLPGVILQFCHELREEFLNLPIENGLFEFADSDHCHTSSKFEI